MTRTGTSHFIDIYAARRYYQVHGYTAGQVTDKIVAGEIHIGRTAIKPGERLTVHPTEGRYIILTQEDI
jgi:hypothetical protein